MAEGLNEDGTDNSCVESGRTSSTHWLGTRDRDETLVGGYQGTVPPVAKPDPARPWRANGGDVRAGKLRNCVEARSREQGRSRRRWDDHRRSADYLRHWRIRSQLLDGTHQAGQEGRDTQDGGVRKLGVLSSWSMQVLQAHSRTCAPLPRATPISAGHRRRGPGISWRSKNPSHRVNQAPTVARLRTKRVQAERDILSGLDRNLRARRRFVLDRACLTDATGFWSDRWRRAARRACRSSVDQVPVGCGVTKVGLRCRIDGSAACSKFWIRYCGLRGRWRSARLQRLILRSCLAA